MHSDELHDRRIGLCDGNNFFVSCERAVDSTLNGRPVVVTIFSYRANVLLILL